MVLHPQYTPEGTTALSCFENVINIDRIVIFVLNKSCLGNIVSIKYNLRHLCQAIQSFGTWGVCRCQLYGG